MTRLGWRVRLAGTHIVGNVMNKDTIYGALVCRVWWDDALVPDKGWTPASQLENAERQPGGQNSALYDTHPPSKGHHLQSDLKRQTGRVRS
jgi:hypothetical protein